MIRTEFPSVVCVPIAKGRSSKISAQRLAWEWAGVVMKLEKFHNTTELKDEICFLLRKERGATRKKWRGSAIATNHAASAYFVSFLIVPNIVHHTPKLSRIAKIGS